MGTLDCRSDVLEAGAQYLAQCLICKKRSVRIHLFVDVVWKYFQLLEKFKCSTEITQVLTTLVQMHLLLCCMCMLMYTVSPCLSLCIGGLFPLWVIINNDAVHIHIQVCACAYFFTYLE